ncbi:uncharacterized protein JCM6883_005985 [Sporobolomyces salmoneus]|uniref:uncharacterized protein n=1 Tax=Sporobolomyces salmoneus TaxID=183962 RepID=UPI00317173C7
MKFGKTYLESLEHVPEEWREQAIEYRKLKKVINRVASELEDLGLTSEVLKELLQDSAKKRNSPTTTSSDLPSTSSATTGQHTQSQETMRSPPPLLRRRESDSTIRRNGSKFENGVGTSHQDGEEDEKDGATKSRIEEVNEEEEQNVLGEGVVTVQQDSETDEGVSGGWKAKGKGKGKGKDVRKRRVRATYELAGTSEAPEPRIHLVFSSASSSSYSSASDVEGDAGLRTPSSSTSDLEEPSSPSRFLFARHVGPPPPSRRRRRSAQGQGNESAQDRPNRAQSDEPEGSRIVELPDSSSEADKTKTPEGGSGDVTEETNSTPGEMEEVEFEGAGPRANGLLRRMYGVGRVSDEEGIYELGEESEGEKVVVVASDLTRKEEQIAEREGERKPRTRSRSDATLRSQEVTDRDGAESVKEKKRREKKEEEAEDAAQADDESVLKRAKRRRRPRQHRKEVYIPLNSDSEFLTLLASALNSLATLQLAQKRQFSEAVSLLAREVSKVSSPDRPKSDLYIWREIFSLWVEAAIFESDRERDRGERSVEEVEKKLDWFVEQVAKRKLAKRMRNKESRVALEKFVALNVELLDLKKFQVANEEAARKILKKHDKRTALTASLGFPKFIAAATNLSSELVVSSNGTPERRVLALPGFPSLPHILLSTFTSTLLPIIPQLEDYECSICGDVAFKPIRLGCGHKFCVRCLVKMQKRGQDNCPQCRSSVVLRANASNLDRELQQFLVKWFPHEVKQKERSNSKEAAKEELEEMGIPDRKCLIM